MDCRRLSVALALWALVPTASAEELRVSVEPVARAKAESVTVQVLSEDGLSRHDLPLAQGRGEVVLELDVSKEWRLQAIAAGYWSAEVTVPAQRSFPDGVVLELHQAGTLAGLVRKPPESPAIDGLALELSPVAQKAFPGSDLQRTRVNCPVEEGSALECEVPAGTWHIRVDVQGFAPLYFWGVDLTPGDRKELGELRLRQGSSLFGEVVDSEGLPVEGATVTLRRAVAGRPQLPELPDGAQLFAQRLVTNAWGFFHVGGLLPGLYFVEAEKPGLATAALGGLAIGRDETIELREPLVLTPPPRIVVEITPGRDPAGADFSVNLLTQAVDGRLQDIMESQAEDGAWASPPLAPGRYVLRVLDSRGGAQAWEEVELSIADQLIAIELDLVSVVGEVFLGDELLSSTLFFGGVGGGVRIPVEAPEGEFELVLPRGGPWTVDVFSEHPRVQARDLEVEVTPRRGTHEAEVTVELPDTRLSGEVVDTEGRHVGGAEVKLTGASGEASLFATAITDPEGRFELRGQQPGPYAVQAEAGSKASQIVPVDLMDGLRREEVRLVLEEMTRLRGRVEGQGGPAAGAYLLAWPFSAAGTFSSATFHDAEAGLDGNFQMELPTGTVSVRLFVMAPGHLLYVGSVEQREMNDYLVLLEREGGGSLRIPLSTALAEGVHQALYIRDHLVPAEFLHIWARMVAPQPLEATAFEVPHMPPGRYLYCELSRTELFAVAQGLALPAAGACGEGFLSPGGQLDLGH